MADKISLKLEGVDTLKTALDSVAKDVRKKSVRTALRKAVQVISKAAKADAPVLALPQKNRKSGTLKRAIVVRPSKNARRAGDEGVFVGVRPLRGARQKKLGRAGKDNPNDPYYWVWQEFGWTAGGPHKINGGQRRRISERASRIASGKARFIPGKRFLSNAASKGPEAVRVFMDSVIPQIEKFNKAK